MQLAKFALCVVFASLPSSVLAVIDSLAPYSGTFHATSSSVFPLTFKTSPRPTTSADFSVAVGLGFGPLPPDNSTNLGGRFIKNYDLVALGHSSTGVGNFTLNVPLHSDAFFSGNGTYYLTAAVTSGFGASYGVVLKPLRVGFAARV